MNGYLGSSSGSTCCNCGFWTLYAHVFVTPCSHDYSEPSFSQQRQPSATNSHYSLLDTSGCCRWIHRSTVQSKTCFWNDLPFDPGIGTNCVYQRASSGAQYVASGGSTHALDSCGCCCAVCRIWCHCSFSNCPSYSSIFKNFVSP